MWKNIPKKYLKNKIVVCSIYHLDGSNHEINEFLDRDKYVDYYHVISKKTEKQISDLTTKKINSIPFWVDENLFFKIENKHNLRDELRLESKKFYIGSFKDTESSDLTSPKLIKGPDRFIKIVESKFKTDPNIEVVLTGKEGNMSYLNLPNLNSTKYFEMVDLILNKLYYFRFIYCLFKN